jgi:hypothetical protein
MPFLQKVTRGRLEASPMRLTAMSDHILLLSSTPNPLIGKINNVCNHVPPQNLNRIIGKISERTAPKSQHRTYLEQQTLELLMPLSKEDALSAWTKEKLLQGTPSVSEQSRVHSDMMEFNGLHHIENVTISHILKYIKWKSETTCNGRTSGEYLTKIIKFQQRLQPGFQWPEWPIRSICKGLALEAPPKTQANPITNAQFLTLMKSFVHDLQMQILILVLTLTGMRADEGFRIYKQMFHSVPQQQLQSSLRHLTKSHVFVAIDTRQESKTGKLDPDSLRLIDVMLLSNFEWQKLQEIMLPLHQTQPIFHRRSSLTACLNHMSLSDHSFKRGCSNIISRLIRDGLISEAVLPMFLKHKTQTEQVASTTAGYLTMEGRCNLLQHKGIFLAAALIRQTVAHDVQILEK